MRKLSNYINDVIINGVTVTEAIKIGASVANISIYSCCPKTREDLEDILYDRVSKEGPNCDLNDIDVSEITDMSWLFYSTDFNGDISNWNVSNVENMENMFFTAKFNGNISRWDVSNVKNMKGTFKYTKFNQDISNWKIRKDCQTDDMFLECPIKEKYKPKLLQEK